eukprot:TRINITY_DN5490_c0_g1_i1.p1 TRINITY_DN5490_c0_g1~~TRINITY_DN5490_c0_g1_i1.p1  ORF type:complete len:411 (+),score=86.52 TRINITY_DN5490_c0_g1_i1:103-1335(+)
MDFHAVRLRLQLEMLKRWQSIDPQRRPFIVAFFAIKLVFVAVIFLGGDLFPSFLSMDSVRNTVHADLSRIANGPAIDCPSDGVPTIVLFRGRTALGESWASGEWAGYGQGEKTVLMNRANGVVVQKKCPVRCRYTSQQTKLKEAEAVLVETSAHAKAMGRYPSPFSWPLRRPGQLWAMFNFEATAAFPYYTAGNKEFASKFDVVMGPQSNNGIPLTSICEWGFPRSKYLNPPPKKTPGNILVSYLTTIPPGYQDKINSLLAGMDGASFVTWSQDATENELNFEKRIAFSGTFKFVLITEAFIEKDWVTAEFSQALLAGAVPVYLGAPNIVDFAPGPKSFIDIRDFPNTQHLVDYLHYLDQNPDEYRKYFDWKKKGLSESFVQKLDQCFHHAECRLCQYVHKKRECPASKG